MHLVYNINLELTLDRRIRNLVYDFPNIVNAVVGSGVNFYHIDARSGRNGLAAPARSAGAAIHGVFTVDGLGKQLGDCRLAGSPRACEKIGVPDAVPLSGF